MQAVLFMGIQASGKSTFFKERFFSTHVRLSLDLLTTRHRQTRLQTVCFETNQRIVVDNTNPTREERAGYITDARAAGYSIVGYYFRSTIEECLKRNAARPNADRVPDVAIISTAKKLELPSFDEGFDQLFYVRLDDDRFVVEEWRDEV